MELFATPVPCIYSDGDQDQSKGQLGIYTALTFRRFQQLMTQKTGVPAAQLSAVLAYKRNANGEEKRQKLNINESTNFGIVLRIHAKEIDAHFVISLKRSKRDRKGASWRKAADVEDESYVKSEGVVAGDASGVEKARRERIEAESEEADRFATERLEAILVEADRNDAERNEVERNKAGRREFERKEVERIEAEAEEADRFAAERLEAILIEANRTEAERNKVERMEADRDAAERENARRDAIGSDRQREQSVQRERFGFEAAKGTGQESRTEQNLRMERNVPTQGQRQRPKTGQDEPVSPVSTLPALPGFFPPSPVSPDREPPELLKKPQTRLPFDEGVPRETPSSNKAAQRSEPIHMGSVKSLPESSRPSVNERAGGVPKVFSEFKPVTILRRPSVSTSKDLAGHSVPQVSTRRPPELSHSEASFSGRPQMFLTPGARPETLTAKEGRRGPVFRSSRVSQVPQQVSEQQEREAFLRQGQEARFSNGVPSSSGRFQQMPIPADSQARFAAFPNPFNRPPNAFSHSGDQYGTPDRPSRGPIMARHVATQPPLATRPGPPHQTAPGSQPVSASVFASAVSAAAEALAPGRHPDARAQAGRYVAGRETGHVASGGSTVGVPSQTRELTPFVMAGLHGVLRDLAAASGARREGFAGFAKTCKFCAFCMERQRGPTPFHWCVDDRVVSGFRGPSPAGPIERPGKHVEAAA